MINVENTYVLKREQTTLRKEIRSLISKRAFIDKAIDVKQEEYRTLAWQIQKLEMVKDLNKQKKNKRKFRHNGQVAKVEE